jgi:hypothetical protein
MTRDEWELRKSEKAPFKQVPFLEVEELDGAKWILGRFESQIFLFVTF